METTKKESKDFGNLKLKTNLSDEKFLKIIHEDEILDGKEKFSELKFESIKPSLRVALIDYGTFFKIFENEDRTYTKFYLLPDDKNVLTLGLAFSNEDDVTKNSEDRLFVLLEEEQKLAFVETKEVFNFRRQREQFDIFRNLIIKATGNNNINEMILYKTEDIKKYFIKMKELSDSLGRKIEGLEIHYLYFNDFKRSDKTSIVYCFNKYNRISFAVRAKFAIEKKEDVFLSESILNFYYDAGDLKP